MYIFSQSTKSTVFVAVVSFLWFGTASSISTISISVISAAWCIDIIVATRLIAIANIRGWCRVLNIQRASTYRWTCRRCIIRMGLIVLLAINFTKWNEKNAKYALKFKCNFHMRTFWKKWNFIKCNERVSRAWQWWISSTTSTANCGSIHATKWCAHLRGRHRICIE